MELKFYELGESADSELTRVIIVSKYNGQWVYCKAKDKDTWELPGGKIEENESSEEAVIRELFEETGLKLEIDRLAIVQERFYGVDNQNYHEIVFFYLIKNGDNVNIVENTFTDQGTDETLHWLPLNSLNEFNIVPKFLKTKSFNAIKAIEHVIVKEE